MSVGDTVRYESRVAKVVSVGCEFCSTLILEDEKGRFSPASPGKVKKVS